MLDEEFTKFEDYVRPDRWKDLDTHFRTASIELEENIQKTVRSELGLKQQARNYLQARGQIKKISEQELKNAEQLLFGSKVCAVDGTYATVQLSTTGIKGQIGVVTTSYVNRRTDYVSYFFEPLIKIENADFADILEARRKMRDDGESISPTQIRAIMLFMERRKVLDREESWKMINGDVFPYELRIGQGRLRGLKKCLELGMELFSNPYVIGVTASSKDYVLNTLALGLESMEYVDVKSYKDELDDFLENAHFNDSDMSMSRNFAETYGNNLRVGIYKAQKRAYIFYAHRENFEQAAAIIMRDSLFQPTRGYPLLIDYADSICTRLVAASDFTRQVNFKLAKYGALEAEADEHSLRRR